MNTKENRKRIVCLRKKTHLVLAYNLAELETNQRVQTSANYIQFVIGYILSLNIQLLNVYFFLKCLIFIIATHQEYCDRAYLLVVWFVWFGLVCLFARLFVRSFVPDAHCNLSKSKRTSDMKLDTDVHRLCQILFLTFRRSRSKFKVIIAVLKIFHL